MIEKMADGVWLDPQRVYGVVPRWKDSCFAYADTENLYPIRVDLPPDQVGEWVWKKQADSYNRGLLEFEEEEES